MTPEQLEALITEELLYFDSDEQREAFRSRRITPRLVVRLSYSDAVTTVT